MNRHLFLLAAVLALQPAAPAAEFLWTGFDSSPTGSVAAIPGWSRASWVGGGLTALVANVNFSHSPSNVLELPWNAVGSSAVFTNFVSTYVSTAEHPVVRFSAKIYCPNTNVFFQIGLRNSAAGHFLSFQNSNGYGCVGFQYRDTVFVPLVSNRFADVTVYYNRSNGYVRLDYDHTNRLAWNASDVHPTVHAQFNQFVATRLNGTAQTTGSLLIDDVSVETFPPHVWAWWRCTSLSRSRFAEQLGSFPPVARLGYGDSARPGSSDPVWDGSSDYRNEGATRQLVAGDTNCAVSIPTSSNWTLEAVYRTSPAESSNVAFLDWSRGLGHNTNVAWIGFGINHSQRSFYYNLRDSQQADGDYMFATAFGTFLPDLRWHHVALVKSNASLSIYLDYQLLTNRNLSAYSGGSFADGSYAFNHLSRACIGRTLGNGNNCGENTLVDEVRISGKPLPLSEFLQPGQPMLVRIDGNAMNNDPWPLTAKCILGKTYRIESSANLSPPAPWTPIPGTTFTSAYTFDFIDVPNTFLKTNWIRLVREN